MKIAVLMTCHNRKETTVRCLRGLSSDVDVYLVDDGSTDGTGEAVREFSRGDRENGRVRVIEGDGSLYWAKGMRLAWEESLKYESRGDRENREKGLEYDGWLWLNDDVELNADALSKLELEVGVGGERILVGELVNARGEVTYGKRGDLFTGNFVYVPRSVYEKIGMISGEYAHAWADSDYAMRAKRAGVKVVSLGVVGKCEGHPNRPSLRGRDLRWRWRSLWDPKGWNVHDLWVYRKRNWGVLAAVVSCAHLILHVLKGEG